MRLRYITEGHWQVAKFDYPNSLAAKTTKIKKTKKSKNKKNRISFLLDPSDRDFFFKR